MIELLALRRRQPILAAALVTVGLRNPITDRLGRRFEIPRQFLRAAAGSNQVNHLPAELRPITWVLLCHCGLRKLNRSGVHESGATSSWPSGGAIPPENFRYAKAWRIVFVWGGVQIER